MTDTTWYTSELKKLKRDILEIFTFLPIEDRKKSLKSWAGNFLWYPTILSTIIAPTVGFLFMLLGWAIYHLAFVVGMLTMIPVMALRGNICLAFVNVVRIKDGSESTPEEIRQFVKQINKNTPE